MIRKKFQKKKKEGRKIGIKRKETMSAHKSSCQAHNGIVMKNRDRNDHHACITHSPKIDYQTNQLHNAFYIPIVLPYHYWYLNSVYLLFQLTSFCCPPHINCYSTSSLSPGKLRYYLPQLPLPLRRSTSNRFLQLECQLSKSQVKINSHPSMLICPTPPLHLLRRIPPLQYLKEAHLKDHIWTPLRNYANTL